MDAGVSIWRRTEHSPPGRRLEGQKYGIFLSDPHHRSGGGDIVLWRRRKVFLPLDGFRCEFPINFPTFVCLVMKVCLFGEKFLLFPEKLNPGLARLGVG